MRAHRSDAWMTGAKAWAGLAAVLAIVAATPAAADILVTREGHLIETRGGWEVRGQLLVFELLDGTLASLRLEEADLEASAERSREAAERARRTRQPSLPPPPAPVEATVVITDRDVLPAAPLAQPPGPGGGEGVAAAGVGGIAATGSDGTGDAAREDGDAPAAGGSAAASSSGVQVVEWSQEPEGDTGMAVRGVIENQGSSFATGLSVNALFYDEAGALIEAREVELEDSPLGPGNRRQFSVSVPDTLIYDEIRFLVVGRGFRSVNQRVEAEAPPSPGPPAVP